MRKHSKLISTFLIIAMLFTLLPTQTLADEIGTARKMNQIVDSPPIEDTKKPEANIVEEITDKRGSNTKRFLKQDMSIEADIYPTAVHYMENGSWKDIDNTLADEQDEENNAVLSNKANGYKVKIAKSTKSNKLVRIQKGIYEISWNMGNLEQSLANIKPFDTSKYDSLSENDKKRTLTKLSSIVSFENIYSGIDLEYDVMPEEVKENIIIKGKSDNPQFIYNIYTKNLTAKLLDDGSMLLYDSNSSKEIFKIDAPFMYDSNKNESRSIKTKLEKKDYGY